MIILYCDMADLIVINEAEIYNVPCFENPEDINGQIVIISGRTINSRRKMLYHLYNRLYQSTSSAHHIDHVYVFSNMIYNTIDDRKYDISVLNNLINNCDRDEKKLIIIDDNNTSALQQTYISDAFINYQYYNMTIIVLTSSIMNVPKNIGYCANYFIYAQETFMQNVNMIWKMHSDKLDCTKSSRQSCLNNTNIHKTMYVEDKKPIDEAVFTETMRYSEYVLLARDRKDGQKFSLYWIHPSD
jgi:hypothetical protein